MSKIDLVNVSVDFPVYNMNARSLKKHFLGLAGGSIGESEKKCVIVKALQNITLSFKDGDRIGLIGHNGAGKSTFLKILAQIYEPSSGQIHVEGNIYPMLNLMHGLVHEFTGYENVLIRGIVSGQSRDEIEKSVDDIAEFSELGSYLSIPIRTYSSGMLLRLAYAVSTTIKPDILLIDEVFGAGDAAFMKKARNRMVSLLEKSKIVVLASHSNDLIKEFCNKAIVLEKGCVKFFGDIAEAINIYNSSLQ